MLKIYIFRHLVVILLSSFLFACGGSSSSGGSPIVEPEPSFLVSQQTSGTDLPLRSIDFYTSSIGIAVGGTSGDDGSGRRGVILKTINGGDNWQIVEKRSDDYFVDVQFVSGDLVFAAGAWGGLFRSTDGGDNWEKIDDYVLWLGEDSIPTDRCSGDCVINFQSLFFVDEQLGFAIHDPFVDVEETIRIGPDFWFKTVDGGLSWRRISTQSVQPENSSSTRLQANDFYFFSEDEAVAVGNLDDAAIAGKTTNGTRYLVALETDTEDTSDETWRTTQLINDSEDGGRALPRILSVDFSRDGDIGFAVGTNIGLLESTDRGENWSRSTIIIDDEDRSDVEFNEVKVYSEDLGLILLNGSINGSNLFIKQDTGQSWQGIEDLIVNEVEFTDEDTIFAVGNDGNIFRVMLN